MRTRKAGRSKAEKLRAAWSEAVAFDKACTATRGVWPNAPACVTRAEWERRFRAHVSLYLSGMSRQAREDIERAELESWPESDDAWTRHDPELAASENLSYWVIDADG